MKPTAYFLLAAIASICRSSYQAAFAQELSTPRLIKLEPTARPNPIKSDSAASHEVAGAGFQALGFDIENRFEVNRSLGLGGRVAFQATIDGLTRILLLDLDTGRIRKLIDGPGNSMSPSWSPDGRRVVFYSDRDGNKEIYSANWQGGDQRRLTQSPSAEESPSWSADGTQIIFSSANTGAAGDTTNIGVMRADGGALRLLSTFQGANSFPKWGPAKTFVTYSTNRFWPGWDICKWDTATSKESCVLSGTASYCRGTWDRAGKRLVYSRGSFEQIDLELLDTSTNQKVPVTNLDGKEYDASFSPDEKLIIFAADSGSRDLYNLHVVDNEKKVSALVVSKTISIRHPTWTAARTIDLESERIKEAEQEVRDAASPTSSAEHLMMDTAEAPPSPDSLP